MNPARAIAAATLAVLTLSACSKNEELVSGTPEPPPSFGAIASKAACPDVDGTYAWPPKEGAPYGYDENGKWRRGDGDFFELKLPDYGELEIRKGERLTLVTRQLPMPNHRGPRMVFRGDARELIARRLECRAGWLVVKEYPHAYDPSLGLARDEEVFIGAKLAVLPDGDLAIGQWRRITGRKAALINFWGYDVGPRFPLPDRLSWYWSRYERR